jgi:hypothetical protein
MEDPDVPGKDLFYLRVGRQGRCRQHYRSHPAELPHKKSRFPLAI